MSDDIGVSDEEVTADVGIYTCSATHTRTRSVGLLTSDYNAGCVTDLTLPISRDARVIPDVLVLDRRDSELSAVVEYSDGGRRLDWVRVLVPENLRCRRTLRLAVQYYRVAHVHVDHLLWRDAKFWWRYENEPIVFILP